MSTSYCRRDATIHSIQGGLLELSVERTTGCGNCAHNVGCAGSLLAPAAGGLPYLHLRAPSDVPLRSGQRLSLSLRNGDLARLAVLYYLLVPVFMVSGAAIAAWLYQGSGDTAALFGCGLGFLIGCAILKLYDSRSGPYWLGLLERNLWSQQSSGV